MPENLLDPRYNQAELPILVGITGHRDILPSALDEISLYVESAMDLLHQRYGIQLRIVSGMAEGADQLIVKHAIKRGIPVIALLPMEKKEFCKTLDGMTELEFDCFLAQAGIEDVIELPKVTQETQITDPSVLQYEQLGIVLCRLCHIMLALWDGVDEEPLRNRVNRIRKKRGGTAHVVSMRFNGEYTEVPESIFAASRLFSERLPRLELARSGPLLHITTPRSSNAESSQQKIKAVWYFQPESKRASAPIKAYDIALLAAHGKITLQELLPKELDKIVEVGKKLSIIRKKFKNECEQSVTYLALPNGLNNSLLNQLKKIYSSADVSSYTTQLKLLGAWSPGLPFSKLFTKSYPLGALFVFSITLPIASLFFEIYCEYGKNTLILLGYILTISISALFYGRVVRKHLWQDTYQDSRAIAEALRVQIYWGASGIPLSVADNYLRFQEDTLGWIRQSLRGPALYSIGAALRAEKNISIPTQGNLAAEPLSIFIESQRKYFSNNCLIMQRALKRVNRWIVGSLSASVIIAFTVFIIQLSNKGHLPKIEPEWLREVPSVLIGFLPALAAYFILVRETRAYDDTLESHLKTVALFERAAQQAQHLKQNLPVDDDTTVIWWQDWNDLTVALGKEALSENGIWIQMHRTRQVEFKMGG
ncbi:hypothetical protein NKW45_00785 [Acetobacter orientalis]|uniref:hypothetical protein n=1 Tax=Acetobacter orientalis TaxID=146474 RepID=UPI0020A27E9B|nr:hypothetical protein [Acetobacter orientalis]MCP1220381.1 hypothetical protein [Acetobacter orientalis]